MTKMLERTSIELTADIVSAFVSNNAVRPDDIPGIITTVHDSFLQLGQPKVEALPPAVLTPAVPIRKSVTDDYIVCLEDGKQFKSLKRHLAGLGLTPAEYRAKWGLSPDYPMTSPRYAAKRSELARATGLGLGSRKQSEARETPEPAAEAPLPAMDSVTPAPAKRGRPKKAV